MSLAASALLLFFNGMEQKRPGAALVLEGFNILEEASLDRGELFPGLEMWRVLANSSLTCDLLGCYWDESACHAEPHKQGLMREMEQEISAVIPRGYREPDKLPR